MDHILGADSYPKPSIATHQVAKMRHNSHCGWPTPVDCQKLGPACIRLPMENPVIIVGGGVMGSALAYWLTRLDPGRGVTVIERDPSYEYASSALSAASIRQQFSTAANIRISQASIAFLRRASDELAIGDERPTITLREQGYLYLAGADAVAENTSDLSLGSLGLSGEGWFDGYALLTAFARKARHQGAHYVNKEVSGFAIDGARITHVVTTDGTRMGCSQVINAAGPWARRVAAMAGVDLPVFARRRTVYVISCPTAMTAFPLLIDTTGFWIRPEGTKFIAGLSPADDANDQPLQPDYEAFETQLWPALAHRIPAFEAAKLERAWAGYFEMNTFDHNAILGPHQSMENLLFMNGFSGHGMQQAPIVGRAGPADRRAIGRCDQLRDAGRTTAPPRCVAQTHEPFGFGRQLQAHHERGRRRLPAPGLRCGRYPRRTQGQRRFEPTLGARRHCRKIHCHARRVD